MRLSNLFTDHCVLQRGESLPVWGWTDKPKIRIKGELNGVVVNGISGDDCKFLLRFPPMKAGGPHTLEVKALEGDEGVIVRDALIGDVWLASGQSNMQWSLSQSMAEEVIENAAPDQVRMITVPNRPDLAPQESFEGKWELSTPETKGAFSAVANYFAQRLQNETGVPIGVINSSWGGTIIETWTSRRTLLRNPWRKSWVERYELDCVKDDRWIEPEEQEPVVFPDDPGNQAFEKGWAARDFDDSAWQTMKLPATWQMAGHEFSGAFWFRRRIQIPESWIGREISLDLGAVDKHDVTYVNGVEVGRMGKDHEQECWCVCRKYTIPAELVKDQELLIAVRAFSFAYGGGVIGPAPKMLLKHGDESLPLKGDWKYKVEHNLGVVATRNGPPPKMGHGTANSPYMCFENMIKPLLPAAIKGAIWYQGESNSATIEEASRYGRLMKDLIEDWRGWFEKVDLPFGMVQLANFRAPADFQDDATWAVIREAQRRALELKNTGMAVIIDVGEAADIHPKDKVTVGTRLAQWALAEVYHKNIVPGSPIYSRHVIEGNRIRIFFDNVGECLKIGERPEIDDEEEAKKLQCFFICGEDMEFKPAKAVIEGRTVVVSHPDIDAPVAARYAWADNPEKANLVNEIGYPASPFKTDL